MKIFVTVQFSLQMSLGASHVLKIDENEFRHQVILITIFFAQRITAQTVRALNLDALYICSLLTSQSFFSQYSKVLTGHINQQYIMPAAAIHNAIFSHFMCFTSSLYFSVFLYSTISIKRTLFTRSLV